MSVTLSHSSPSSICPAHPPKPSPKAKTWRPLNAHLIRVEKIHPFSAVPEALVLVFMILLTVAAFLCVDLAWEVPGTPFSSIWEAFLREVLSILTDIAIYVQEESDDKEMKFLEALKCGEVNFAFSNKCIAARNKRLTSSDKKLLETGTERKDS